VLFINYNATETCKFNFHSALWSKEQRKGVERKGTRAKECLTTAQYSQNDRHHGSGTCRLRSRRVGHHPLLVHKIGCSLCEIVHLEFGRVNC
jgi:hypothetical protein